MPNIILLVGPQGSGKSTYAATCYNCTYINQDTQGKEQHLDLYLKAIDRGEDVVVDRINFSVEQRLRYLKPAKDKGYTTTIIVFHESYDTCLDRILKRENHPTIKDRKTAIKALNFFFSRYERVQDNEADHVVRKWPHGDKPKVFVNDIDGCLADASHRLKYVKGPGKKDWGKFFSTMDKDPVNEWNKELVKAIVASGMPVVCCSGRPAEHYELTWNWLMEHEIPVSALYMRYTGDYRSDSIAKENLLDFELLTRYTPVLFLDDRQRVVDVWRSRGYVCLQCAEGDF